MTRTAKFVLDAADEPMFVCLNFVSVRVIWWIALKALRGPSPTPRRALCKLLYLTHMVN
jgi:hypothetical protein